MSELTISYDDVDRAITRIWKIIRRTPVLSLDGSELDAPGKVSLKLEFLQHGGSFKARGAANFMEVNDIGPAGVVAASGGNHGVAVAWAAESLGHRATIFVPTISSRAKVERLRGFNAEVHVVGKVYADALEASAEFQASSGATPVHAYNDPAVMAGAGTASRELEFHLANQDVFPDAMLVACGGGGLAGGTAAWLDGRSHVVACETEGTSAFAQAIEAGGPVDVEVSGLAADALGPTRIGDLAWEQLAAANATSVVVTDDETVAAQAVLWDRLRILVEPSAAVPLAALRSGRYQPGPAGHTAIILCGANTSPSDFRPI